MRHGRGQGGTVQRGDEMRQGDVLVEGLLVGGAHRSYVQQSGGQRWWRYAADGEVLEGQAAEVFSDVGGARGWRWFGVDERVGDPSRHVVDVTEIRWGELVFGRD